MIAVKIYEFNLRIMNKSKLNGNSQIFLKVLILTCLKIALIARKILQNVNLNIKTRLVTVITHKGDTKTNINITLD